MANRPDIIIVMTDEERAVPPYESAEVLAWRQRSLTGRRWFDEHGISFTRHYTGSLACVPSRPTIFTGQYPDLHGVTQTDGIGKRFDDSRLRWLRAGEVPTLGNWFRAAGYDTHYDGKWHISHADLEDPATGAPLATNDNEGVVDSAAVRRYLDADPLGPYGFSGWVGPEPHGAGLANSGFRRDPLVADRVVAWLTERYARRRAGDTAAMRPFLLVASFVNPHDIVLFPAWVWRSPLKPSPLDPPHVPAAPTADEDLSTKPAAQVAYREAYYSGYGLTRMVSRNYARNAQRYRDLYYRLHAEVDGPIDRVRRAVTEGGSEDAMLVRTSDHGDLLGAHGGLHQKWFNLYDEATRVPFVIARIGEKATQPRTVSAPTSHVDLVPTLLSAAGVDVDVVAAALAESFSEVHPLPGRDLMPVVDGASADEGRAIYLMTRDNVLEGDTGASLLSRQLGRIVNPPAPLRIKVPAHVAANFDAMLVRTSDHGDLLGAHGGLHQKWFNLYDEATRVPFVIARIGEKATQPRTVSAPTSHVDLVPTLLSAAGVDVDVVAAALAESFSEVHPLPGRDLMPVVDGASADEGRAIYLMTRDNVLEGDTGASLLSRQLGRIVNPPAPLRIKVPAHVAANFEGLVVRVDDTDAAGGAGHLWKLVRTFDDPATWTEPGVRHLATNGMGGDAYRTDPLDDQWELYDLTADPIEAYNRWTDPQLHELRQHLRMLLKQQRAVSVPERNQPWPYAHRLPPSGASNGLVRRVLGRFVR
ncbi:hydrolase [Mycobacterium tuberculosis]|uniref:sulfatase-like hydrolase/transferase n=2 Tax=Mycobacterium tuberculosis TaxID=1773 RepID=UPI00045A240F|nr:sulfatase-like hydrolase/transferase [Mycobacterium tuberculosis]AWY73928.1 hydrolase [Mycobacterium tuberculosis]KCB14547.1 hydrolase [Mycobacterium tuberculosis TKK-01-0094]BAX50338.1 hydrolase [Mycobacterium tuberculosis]